MIYCQDYGSQNRIIQCVYNVYGMYINDMSYVNICFYIILL